MLVNYRAEKFDGRLIMRTLAPLRPLDVMRPKRLRKRAAFTTKGPAMAKNTIPDSAVRASTRIQ
jgi:hypothetical protein